ncbi:MAG: SpoIIE family protein phosphatase [Bacteroidales bacterium]|nr:SpoIIE family protein phosphatase [Bacteroidales bacterium]
MTNKLFCLTVIILLSLSKVCAHQIDAEHYLTEIKIALSVEDSATIKLKPLSDRLNKLDTAKLESLLSNLIANCESVGDDKTTHCLYLLGGVYYFNRKLFEHSLEYFNNAVKYCHRDRQLEYLDFLRGLIFINIKKYQSGYNCLLKIAEKDIENNEITLIECESYKAISEYYTNIGNQEYAIKYLKKYAEYSDSLNCQNVDQSYYVLPAYIQSKYIDKQIYYDNQEEIDEMNNREKDQQNLIYILVLLGTILLSVTFIFSYKTIKLKKENVNLNNSNIRLDNKTIQLEHEKSSFASLALIAGETANAFSILDNTGKISWVNNGFEKLYGQNMRQYILHNGDNMFASKNIERRKTLEQCRHDKITKSCEIMIKTSDNDTKWIQSTISPVIENNKIIKYVVVDNDISRIKKAEANLLLNNKTLTTQNIQIQTQKDQLEKQNFHINQQNELITGSIRYAQTIQKTLLPNINHINDYYKTFVIYKPKDIVSGDFYWFYYDVETNSSFIAVGDCTGHGVPGAFMSILSMRLLDEIIINIKNPAEILNQLEIKVINVLKQRETENTDGLDISIARIEPNDNDATITVAGAKSYFFYHDYQLNKTEIVKGTKKSIGGLFLCFKDKAFENNIIHLKKGDRIFLSSDGIIDQNNTERRWFGSPRLIETISDSSSKSIEEQKQYIEKQLIGWQQSEPQRDDICVVGLQI